METHPLKTDMISVDKAVQALDQLQAAAVPEIATTLFRVTTLLQTLADENAYLLALLLEKPEPASPQQGHPAPATTHTVSHSELADEAEDAPEHHYAIPLLTGLNEALRPPLIAIRGRAELVQAGLLGQITPEQERWLQAVEDNTRRAFSLLDTVQSIVGLNTGQTILHPTSFPPRDLLETAYERARDKARAYQHRLVVHPSGQLPFTQADFYQALAILTELIDNAIYYTPPGGVIELSVDSLGTHILFSITDNGIGLSEDDLQQVGRAYWRCERQELVRQKSGTGLHLYGIRQALEHMGGELIFDSELNQGSTFSFTLPVVEG